MGFAAGDTNLRRYVGNNVTNAIDPSGLKLLVAGKPVSQKDLLAVKKAVSGVIYKDGPIIDEILKKMERSKITFHHKTLAGLENNVLARLHVIGAAHTFSSLNIAFATRGELAAAGPTSRWKGEKPGMQLDLDKYSLVNGFDEFYVPGSGVKFDCVNAAMAIQWKGSLNFLQAKYPKVLGGFEKKLEQDERWVRLTTFSQTTMPFSFVVGDSNVVIPGDMLYFRNESRRAPVWRGEAAIYLGNNQYYAHGIDGQGRLVSEEQILAKLNRERVPNPKFEAERTSTRYFLYPSAKIN